MASAKTPTPIASKKTAAKPVEPAEPTTLEVVTDVTIPTTPVEPTTPEPTAPKLKLSWAEKMKALPPEQAKLARAKAAEQSRISKAKKRGTTPELSKVLRLKSRLSTNLEKTALLEADRIAIEQELTEIEAQLVANQAEQAVETDGENAQV